MTKTRRKIDAALKAKIAVEEVWEQAIVADLARRYGVHPNQIYSWEKRLLESAAPSVDGGVGRTLSIESEQMLETAFGKSLIVCWKLPTRTQFCSGLNLKLVNMKNCRIKYFIQI